MIATPALADPEKGAGAWPKPKIQMKMFLDLLKYLTSFENSTYEHDLFTRRKK